MEGAGIQAKRGSSGMVEVAWKDRARPWPGSRRVPAKPACSWLNLPEVKSAFKILGVPTVCARFGTAPFFWNWGMQAFSNFFTCCMSSPKRSSRGFDQLMTSHYLPIVEGIIDAMSEIGGKSLATEGCHTTLLALRYTGNHHRCFWSNSIDEVLCKILAGSYSSEHQTHEMLCHGELFKKNSKDIINHYVWDMLGYLAVHCNNEYLSVRRRQHSSL